MTLPTADPDASDADIPVTLGTPIAHVEIALHRQRPIRPHDAVELFREEGWWPNRTPSTVAALLEGSLAAGAWHGERFIGFARAITDGVERAYVEDVVVTHDYRRSGIGAQLVEVLMKQLAHIPAVSLFCTADLVDFYELSGFHRTHQVVMHREIGS
jgi:GNAT superfamily N-acetyltransferase